MSARNTGAVVAAQADGLLSDVEINPPGER